MCQAQRSPCFRPVGSTHNRVYTAVADPDDPCGPSSVLFCSAIPAARMDMREVGPAPGPLAEPRRAAVPVKAALFTRRQRGNLGPLFSKRTWAPACVPPGPPRPPQRPPPKRQPREAPHRPRAPAQRTHPPRPRSADRPACLFPPFVGKLGSWPECPAPQLPATRAPRSARSHRNRPSRPPSAPIHPTSRLPTRTSWAGHRASGRKAPPRGPSRCQAFIEGPLEAGRRPPARQAARTPGPRC
jgi:hypothetical protein